MRPSVFICLLLFSLSVSSQVIYDSTKLSPLIKKIAFQIDTTTQKDWSFHYGYKNLVKLLGQRAKVYELVQLTNHRSPFVRLNAFNLLLDSAYPKFIDIIEQHITDTAAVYLWSGHEAEQTNVFEGMLRLVSWNNSWVGTFEFTEEDVKRLAALGDRYWNSKKK